MSSTPLTNIPCQYSHQVAGVTPNPLDVHLDGRTCDCGRIKFVAEDCGCINNPHKELRSHPNG